MKIPYPWTAVNAVQTEEQTSVSTLGREYVSDGSSVLFSSVVSAGKELLARPAEAAVDCRGRKSAFCEAQHFLMRDDDGGASRSVISAAESDGAVLNAHKKTEFDGCTFISLALMPKGRSVAAEFGMEKPRTDLFDPQSLKVEFPLKKELFPYYSIFPKTGVFSASGEPVAEYAGAVPEKGMYGGFKPGVYLHGDEVGLGLYFESDEGMIYEKDRFFEIEEREDCLLLRVNLLCRKPDAWDIEDPDRRIDLFPLRFAFIMQVAPVRSFPENALWERCFHLDCFKKTPGDYDGYLSGEIPEGGGESGFDRLERLGVKTLYLHEKWNDIQNSPRITEKSAKRLKYIVDECHARGIKVVPYFGYELSTLSPVYAGTGLENARVSTSDKAGWFWYRKPYQRDLQFCLNSGYGKNGYPDELISLCEEIGFDGFYFDGTNRPSYCMNARHGCGYEDEKGVRHGTYPIRAVREFMKRVYAFAQSTGRVINCHGTMSLPTLGFCDSLWEGELFQIAFLHGEVRKMPGELLRAVFPGTDIGVPVFSLCYSAPPVWTFRNALAMALLHGSLPKPVDIGEPLELMSGIWDAYEDFGVKQSGFKPYFAPTDKMTSDDPDVFVSAYESEGKLLAICALGDMDAEKDVVLRCRYPVVTDALDGSELTRSGVFTIHLKGIDFRLCLAAGE